MSPRIVLYTHSAVLAPALSLAHALSQSVECHLLLEVAPQAWQTELFDVTPPAAVRSGILPAESVIGHAFPEPVRALWRDLASFLLVVHDTRRAVHPLSWRLSRQVAHFIRSLQPDVVHFDDVSRRMVPVLPLLRGLPIVLSLHDPAFHSGEMSWRADLFRRLMLRYATRIVLHNRQLKGGFCNRYGVAPGRVSVVHLGAYRIARLWAEPAPVPEDPMGVLFFGRLSSYKGLDTLYAAMPSVARGVPGAHFTVAGPPQGGYQLPPRPALPSSSRLDVLSQYVPNAMLARLFQASSVVVCPYRAATQSGVALTAYAFDKPVVATRTGGLPEYVHDHETGLLVPPADPAALAEALVALLGNDELRCRLKAGISQREHTDLSWARAAAEMLGVYREAMRTLTK